MWTYYLELACRQGMRSKALTGLIVALLVAGVSSCVLCMSVLAVAHADPLPSRSSHIYSVSIDSLGPGKNINGEPSDLLSYLDAQAMLAHAGTERTTVNYPTRWTLDLPNSTLPPRSLAGDAVTAEFFRMFGVDFQYGSGWLDSDDASHAAVAVISSALNQQWFGGRNSVGRQVLLDGQVFRIVGVIGHWNPKPRFFDVAMNGPLSAFEDSGGIYVPFARAIDQRKQSLFAFCSYGPQADNPDWQGLLNGGCGWISAWVVLPTSDDVQGYARFLDNYAREQQTLGRFGWPPNVRLTGLMAWLAHARVIPKGTSLTALVALSFLLIAIVNVTGLMLARFMRRAPEIGVRRALGASRRDIYRQLLIEAALIGLAGGVLSLLATCVGLHWVDQIFEPSVARWVRIDPTWFGLTLAIAVLSAAASAAIPAWRAAQVSPAWQIKING
jgi:putative ABC transport system permease protein